MPEEGTASGRPDAAVHGSTAAYGLLVGMSAVFGLHWVIAKWALTVMGPYTFTLARVGVGLGVVVLVAGARGRLHRPDRADLPVILSVGLGQILAGALLMSLALGAMPAGRSAVLVYTMPLWVAVAQLAILRVRPTPSETLGLVLGLTGVLLLLNPSSLDWHDPGELAGTGMLLLSAVIWALTTIHVRRHRWRSSPFELGPWQLLVALVPLLVVAPLAEPGLPVDWSAATAGVLAYSGGLATAFTMWATQSITRALGAQAATTGFQLVPMIGLASGAVLLAEPLATADLAGFVLIVAGVVATARRSAGALAAART